MVKRDTERLIGICGFYGWKTDYKRANFDCEIDCEYWRMGYGTEAIEKIIDYGYHERELVRIGAVVLPGNNPSIQFLRNYQPTKKNFLDTRLFIFYTYIKKEASKYCASFFIYLFILSIFFL
ncbi:GNAT family N-acetyltransferase [Bacillus coreaensis]